MSGAYYNEIDPFAAAWLRNLIAAGHIAPGDVDERTITDVKPEDLKGYRQCHFFAGIGVWSYALRLAGWPDDRPVWTGSCPCQPFSAAGKRGGTSDERHLWPAFGGLIAQCRPRVVFGEQVASKDGLAWLDIVHADLEAAGYAVGALDLCAAGLGAPHIRQRLFFVADADGGNASPEGLQRGGEHGQQPQDGGVGSRQLADSHGSRRGTGRSGEAGDGRGPTRVEPAGLCAAGHGLEHPPSDGRQQRRAEPGGRGAASGCGEGVVAHAGSERLQEQRGGWDEPQGLATAGFWRDAEWLPCIDGKARPVSPKPQPLVDGSAASLGPVRAADIAALEREIDGLQVEGAIDVAAGLRNLQAAYAAESQRCWPVGGIPQLHEAPFLLAFLRQLAQQGWRFAECTPIPRAEAAQATLRSVRDEPGSPGASHQHGLAGQPAGERANTLHLLSSLLARHAHSAWAHAYATYAEIGFPLCHGAPARVGRLRAYGNAIVAPVAVEFIRAYNEALT